MVHLAALLMPSGPKDVTTEQIVQVFARQQWKPETRKAYRNTIRRSFDGCTKAAGEPMTRVWTCRG